MPHITATLVGYYHLCHRKMWLHANEIRMEHTSEVVAEGKQLHEQAYPQRAERYREIELDGSKIDFYDPYDKVVHEIKKSDKMEGAHIAQVKYYLYLLQRNGIDGATGIIEYPKLRQTERVRLDEGDSELIERWVQDIERIVTSEQIPGRLTKSKCRSCSYFDFCWIDE